MFTSFLYAMFFVGIFMKLSKLKYAEDKYQNDFIATVMSGVSWLLIGIAIVEFYFVCTGTNWRSK